MTIVNNSPIVICKDVCYRYENQVAVKNITCIINKGEHVALIGANGSGKSTLLLLLNGLIFPLEGSIQINGELLTKNNLKNPNRFYSFRKFVGFCFQNSAVQLFCPTVFEDISFALLQMKYDPKTIENKVNEIMNQFDILHLKNRAPYTLSGGEQKKVALASVFVYKPSLLLFDEPTASLDPRSQSMLIDMIGNLKSQKITTVTATHDLLYLEELADRAIVISEKHTITWDGPVKDLLKNKALLLKHNLIHDHTHKHDTKAHRHSHIHNSIHFHT